MGLVPVVGEGSLGLAGVLLFAAVGFDL